MPFCSNCGNQIANSDKFCIKCGTPIQRNSSIWSSSNDRKVSFAGEIKKCPNCGEIINSFTPNCPSCGYELRNTKTTNYILEFSKKIEAANSSKQKDDLIRHFVMPNTKEDIYEFMILAATNLEAGGDNTDAWLIKLEQAHQKAKIVFDNSPEIKYLDELYNNATRKYKNSKATNRFSSLGQFFSNHKLELLLIFLVFFGLILIFLGSIFGIGPVCDWHSTTTTGHLWWKEEHYKWHSWPYLTIIGTIIAGLSFILSVITIAIKSGKKRRDQNMHKNQ